MYIGHYSFSGCISYRYNISRSKDMDGIRIGKWGGLIFSKVICFGYNLIKISIRIKQLALIENHKIDQSRNLTDPLILIMD